MNPLVLAIRTFVRNRLLDLLSINSKPNPGVHILNGHFLSINDNASPIIFENLLNGLVKNGVNLINFTTAVDYIVLDNYPKDHYFVAFSFDDGFEECYTKIKPILDKFDIKAAFFINPGFIEGDESYRQNFTRNIVKVVKNPMSWEQISVLVKEGHTIGAHTVDHTNLNIDKKDILTHQIGGCKELIEQKLDIKCSHFAFPFGKLEHISKQGVAIAKQYFPYVYSQSNYRYYFSFNGMVINRRHFECDWPLKHVLYFLKSKLV